MWYCWVKVGRCVLLGLKRFKRGGCEGIVGIEEV